MRLLANSGNIVFMSFFVTALNTLYKPEFYEGLKEKTLKNTIGYFAKLTFFFALFGALLAAVFVSPIVSKIIADLEDEITTYYPADLEIKIEKGVATSNAKTEPLFFPIKENWKKIASGNISNTSSGFKTPENIFVLNTRALNDVTTESFKNMNTYSLLTSRHFISYDTNHNIVFKELSALGDTKISKDTFAKLFALARFIPLILPVFYFTTIYISVFSLLLFMIFVSFVFLLTQGLLKNPISFKDSYKTCVFASSVPIFLTILFFLAGIPPSGILILLLLMTLAVAILNTKSYRAEEILS